MKEKDIAYIKILQYVNEKGKVKFGGKGGIYESFDMIPNDDGAYENKGNWPFSSRSLARYIDELCEIGLLKCNGKGLERTFSINEDKYSFNLKIKSKDISSILSVFISKNQMELFDKISSFRNNSKNFLPIYNADKVNKFMKRINIPYENVKENEPIETLIKEAICDSKIIDVAYKSKIYTIIPLAIVKSLDKNKKYLFYLRKKKIGQPFDLMNIKDIDIKESINIENSERLKEIEHRWDIDGGNKTIVKILFFNEDNVIISVKRDIIGRSAYELIKVDDGYLYTDTVEGINDFKRWVRKYSQKCIVIEPESLRNEILNSNKQKLSRYGEETYGS